MTERENQRATLTETTVLHTYGAAMLREAALTHASVINVNGFVVIYDGFGLQLNSEVFGSATKQNVSLAEAKAKTVLATQRSSSVQRDRMKERGQTVDDFGGTLGSLFGGGVAIFADREKSKFVGAVAFSGGTQEEDEEICRRAVEEVGLFTDLPEPTPTD